MRQHIWMGCLCACMHACVCVCVCIGPFSPAYGVYVRPGESSCKEPGLSHSSWTEWKDWTASRFQQRKENLSRL